MNDDLFSTWSRYRKKKQEAVDAIADGVCNGEGFYDEEVYSDIRRAASRWGEQVSDIAQMTVMVPAGVWTFSQFLSFPDLDISTLGIGYHRYFLFHSAAAPWMLSKIYEARLARTEGTNRFSDKVINRLLGIMAASGAWAVGVHLAVDVMQPKSVIFPFIGSLFDGTMIDDEIWLLGNSIYCFRLGNRMFALAMGEDLSRVKAFVRRNIRDPLLNGLADAVPGRP